MTVMTRITRKLDDQDDNSDDKVVWYDWDE